MFFQEIGFDIVSFGSGYTWLLVTVAVLLAVLIVYILMRASRRNSRP
jgi:bacteriorhodopsin